MTDDHTTEAIRERAALYALGGLGQPEARAFEAHLDAGCAECLQELEAFDAVVEQLAWASFGLSPAPEVRQRLLARIEQEAAGEAPTRPLGDAQMPSHDDAQAQPHTATHAPEAQEQSAGAAPRDTDALGAGAPHSNIFTVAGGAGGWAETEDAGVFMKHLFKDERNRTITYLLRMEPGSRVPPHRHPGTEQCLVLEGDVSFGQVKAAAGDYVCAPNGVIDSDVTTQRGSLLYIIAPDRIEPLPHAD